jgi:hypothetical protein
MQNPGVLWFMIKKCQMAIKFRITIEESFGIIQKLLVMGFETNRGERRFSMHAERSGRPEIIAICIAVTMPL